MVLESACKKSHTPAGGLLPALPLGEPQQTIAGRGRVKSCFNRTLE